MGEIVTVKGVNSRISEIESACRELTKIVQHCQDNKVSSHTALVEEGCNLNMPLSSLATMCGRYLNYEIERLQGILDSTEVEI